MRLKNSINENFYTTIEIRYPIIENDIATVDENQHSRRHRVNRGTYYMRKSKNAGCLNKAVRIISIKGFI